ncbi:hypothetical protein M2323_004646 [Rhodoblastus acidophilus]|nr:hypothetical protein [Rhodoblastus acidophilus]MCW2335694.1 hypothetical protein [Rhodoblastus acidophilus]
MKTAVVVFILCVALFMWACSYSSQFIHQNTGEMRDCTNAGFRTNQCEYMLKFKKEND